MKQEVRFLLETIKYMLHDGEGESWIFKQELDWDWLVRFAKRHSLAHLLYYGVEHLPLAYRPSEKACQILYQYAMQELVRSCNQTEAMEEIFDTFEKEELYVLAVKGVCTKQRYAKSEVRSMGDIDILCHESQQDKVRRMLIGLGYEYESEGRKHDHYHRKPYINLEMHRELVATDSEYGMYYEDVWSKAQPREGCRYTYEMGIEDEYIFNLIHLVEHFRNGGVGIRFVMDVYVYNHKEHMDWDYIQTELQKLQLWEFYQKISALAELWFGKDTIKSNEEHETLEQMASYIISNGTFGTIRNQAALSVAKKGRNGFLIQTLFPNLKNMQSMFPWLHKWPILLPYSWILRGVRSLLFRRKNIKKQFYQYKHGEMEYGEKLEQFFEDCGL